MTEDRSTAPVWVIAHLGEDLNWWMDESSEENPWVSGSRSVLDTRQVAHLTAVVPEYRPYGLHRKHLRSAFWTYAVESELSDGRLRLAFTKQDLFASDARLFAIPVIEEDGVGPYFQLLDLLAVARIRMLNATHHYARECTELDLFEELDGLNHDRYFSMDSIHSFDEMNEILQWSPAEWDES